MMDPTLSKNQRIEGIQVREGADLPRQQQDAERVAHIPQRHSELPGGRKPQHAEMQRQVSWPHKTHHTSAIKNRCRLTHEVRFREIQQGLYTVRFSLNGEIVATGYGNGTIQIRNGNTGDLTVTLKHGQDISMPIMCCRFNPVHKDIFYASSASGNIYICTVDTKEFSKFILEPNNEVNTIDVSVSGDYLVSGGKDATVRLYDAETAELIVEHRRNEENPVHMKNVNYHRMRIFASRFHNVYPNLIITGGWDDTVRIWDVRVPEGSIRVIKGPHICGDAIDIHDTHILTGSWTVRDSLQVWDLMSAKLIETINPQNRPPTLSGEFLYVVRYFHEDPNDELVLVGGSGIGAVEMISLIEKKVMGSFSASKPIYTLDNYRNTILFGGMESVLRLGEYT